MNLRIITEVSDKYSVSKFRAKNSKNNRFSRPINITELHTTCLTRFDLRVNNVMLLRKKIFRSRLTLRKKMLDK